MIYLSLEPLLSLGEAKKTSNNNNLEYSCERRLRQIPDNVFFQARRWKDVNSVQTSTLAWTLVKPQNAAFIQAFPAFEGHLAVSHIRIYPSELRFSGGEFFSGEWVKCSDLLPSDGSYFTTNQWYNFPPPRHVEYLRIEHGRWWSNFWQREVEVGYWWENTPLPCEEL